MMPESLQENIYPLGFLCARKFWNRLQLTDLFSAANLPNRTYLRQLVAKGLREIEPDSLTAAELEILATLNQVLLQIGRHYLASRNCQVTRRQLTIAEEIIELPQLDRTLQQFVYFFPVAQVITGKMEAEQLLQQIEANGRLDELLLQLFLLQVQSRNPALRRASALFQPEEQLMQANAQYTQQLRLIDQALPELDDGFSQAPASLLDRLSEPLAQGDNLREQLQFLQQRWGSILPPELLERISSAFAQHNREGLIPGPLGEPELIPLDPANFADQEYANFTSDIDWMPRTVLLAKSTYVWLQQLSSKYSLSIRHLSQVPDEELDQLAAAGFTSLWLIGIWQRSKASLKIKNLCGQLQVAASAYAIDDYIIADDLGGEAALDDLRQRCAVRGIDLACDVVTNHTGVESAWLREHPDWFIQLPHPPYPGYRFTGPDLSENPEYAVQIEDGYYDHSEAAVVCRYQQRQTGEVRYIYHGNDGTHLPWNDTAQLNYLLPEVREAMIQLIIRVARRFRVIRFDAAMTLAKRHFQRLWYPLPGGGEGVPSRADYAMPADQFHQLFPQEFWRELVDRIRVEVPDTLLVAEAFWLMEGYFVRTLGMHRVYNSAFMNMLKQEENAKYRQTLKNIMAFDPAILQRFVNFMSNPDEKPAVEQFGKGGKYFCVATMLATMPGLPMFGHGQVEGLHEKYGMEYLAPRWDETVDLALVEQHRRQIFPLLKNRALFSGAEHFQLYDFISDYGVEENVFAYSNRLAERRVLVLCNNSNHRISGRIGPPVDRAGHLSVSFAEACGIAAESDFTLLNDISHRLSYLEPSGQLAAGGHFTLEPYSSRVLTDSHALQDPDGRWQVLWQRYAGRGQRRPWIDHEALPLEPAMELCRELLEIERPDRAKRKLTALLHRLQDSLSSAGLAELKTGEFLEKQIRIAYADNNESEQEAVTEILQQFDSEQPLSNHAVYRLLDRLFNQPGWRKLTKCNYYNDIDWFDKDAFARATELLLLFLLFRLLRNSSNNFKDLMNQAGSSLKIIGKTRKLALKTSFQVDNFLHDLDEGPQENAVIPVTGGGTSMKVLFVTPEASPFAKTGGLADVAGSLPRALRQLGHDVRVILPCYRSAETNGHSLRKGRKSVEIELAGKAYRGSLKQTAYDGVPYWFIDCPKFFDRESLYGNASGDYPDNDLRFGFFSRAVLKMIKRLDFRPDVIHIHDWQTCHIPVLLRTELKDNPFYNSIATLLTIHNLGYQGVFPIETMKLVGFHDSLKTPEALEYYGNLSLLKGGINFSDVINTVSPTYCREIQQVEQGHGFDGILRNRTADLYGIINGLDRRSWDPALDTALPTAFSSENLNGKRACKRLLQKELGLTVRHDVPIVAVISRLDRQKGIDLIEQAWPQLLARDIQFVLLGSGNREATNFWRTQKDLHPEQVSINLVFDEQLSRRVFAGSDILLVPSRYEPCGLTQMISLNYGSLPIVRKTGGLADTVLDVSVHPKGGFGFVFDNSDPEEMLAALDRALQIFPNRSRWLSLVKRGMGQDFSWGNSANHYHELYTKARNYRQIPAA